MQDLNDLYYFVRVVDHGGFAAAARKTGIQKSRLSRRIQQLEARLGVRLLNRSSRRFSVTELGREYYERCVAVLVRAEAADQVIAQMQAEPRGIVRVSCQRPRRDGPCRFPVAARAAALGARSARLSRRGMRGGEETSHRVSAARTPLCHSTVRRLLQLHGYPSSPSAEQPLQPPVHRNLRSSGAVEYSIRPSTSSRGMSRP